VKREYKFRAWYPKGKVMVPKRLVNNMMMPVVATKRGFKLKSKFTLMQYIGQTDLKDREIYEGDVVVCRGFEYVVCWCDINHWWYFRQLKDEHTPYAGGISGQGMRSCIVLGNIYENPEFLKGRFL
jgi:hypothetical protein